MKRTLSSALVVSCVLMTCASAAIAAPLHSSSVALRPSLASGWVEVTYKDAQVAVPSSFSVVYPNE
jgi:hypothetical protein